MDDDLATEARHRGISKAALIRILLRQGFGQREVDPVESIIGGGDGRPAPDIDEVVYGR